MSYEYESYSKAKYSEIIGENNLTQELSEVYLAAVREPNLTELLEHQLDQVRKAKKAEVTDYRYSNLEMNTENAAKALDTGNISKIAAAFIDLGKSIESLRHPSHDEMHEMRMALMEKMKSEMPLRHRNIHINFLKSVAQDYALHFWSKDAEQKLRLSDACHKVWQHLVEVADRHNCTKELPEKAESLKAWLRPIAPEYARKAGRPKK